MALRPVAGAFLAVFLAAPAAAAEAPPSAGAYGTARKGPTTPVCVVGRPCTAPAAHVRVLFVRAGRSVATTTDRAGRYRLALRPGTYLVRLGSPPRIGGLAPVSIVVPQARYRRLDLTIDTGIR